MLGGDGDGLLYQDVFACGQDEAGVLVVVGVWGSYIDDIYIWVFNEFLVRAICFCRVGRYTDVGAKVLGSLCRC